MPYTVINLGGIVIGCAILIGFGIRWWFREGHDASALIPFVLAHLYGMIAALATYTAWSLLGMVTWAAIWAGNAAGYAGLVWGVGGTDRNITRATPVVLTEGGFVIVFLLTVVFLALWLWARKIPRGKLAAGAVSGALLALSGTVAGIAAIPLGSAVNGAGAVFTAYMQ
ncbi:hypothetical protein ACFQ9J_28470 [Streptomyces sp. NPDC056529]|uniref:hypothetical protein n=1 Tax=Streptomyces sp. NPDC056529 TaxID=3345855 RepID=UPI0036938399